MDNYSSEPKRINDDERQRENRVRGNLTHSLVDEVKSMKKASINFLCPRKFTLIELLIVMAIIAILASLLLPALAKVRLKGKEIHCLSNLKQLGVAATLYASDYNGFFPGGGYAGWPVNRLDAGSNKWRDFALLYYEKYVGSKVIYFCPANDRWIQFDNATYGWTKPGNTATTSSTVYVHYWYTGGYNYSGTGLNGLARVNGPSGPSNGWSAAPDYTPVLPKFNPSADVLVTDTTITTDASNTLTADPLKTNHCSGKPQGNNECFIDGHVKFIRADKLKARCGYSKAWY